MALENWQREILKHGELYRVGGSVRDRLMGVEARAPDSDYLVRGIPPEALESILSGLGRVSLVGKHFAVFKFKAHGRGEEVDIAFPREEVSTGPGHREFDVRASWDLPVEADLRRRDFTINAIAQNVLDGALVDPFDGERDIRRKVLRMVFPKAFEEDPLRILRGVRFAARFSLTIEAQTERAMKASVSLLETLSPERIQEEITKLLTQCDTPSGGFRMLRDLGALRILMPELERGVGVEQNEYHPDDIFVHSLKTCDCVPKENLLVRWAAILHDLGKVDKKRVIEETGSPPRIVFYGHEFESAVIGDRILGRLRYPNSFVERCHLLVRNHMFNYQPEWSPATVRRFIRRVGEENLPDLFLLREADCCSRDLEACIAELTDIKERVNEEIARKRALKISDLAISGRDVMEALGVAEGPEVGRVLSALLEAVLESPGLNTRERLIELAKKLHSNGKPL